MQAGPLLLSALAATAVTAFIAIVLVFRRGLSAKGAAAMRLAVAENQHIPPSLHPVIDANLCIGSFSCIKACPEGDIIGVIDGVAQLVEAAHCIGHGRCATECPVGAIRLVFGSAEKGVDLPETDEGFESSRPGVYIVGELGGMGLIKNALRQGVEVGRVLKQNLKKSEASAGKVDVVIVGGGPAGVAAAISCKEQGLVARVFEQESMGGCIAQYPRGKVVMSEAVNLPYYGRFGRSLLSKEELIDELNAVLAKADVKIEEGNKVTRIEGNAGDFTVGTSAGQLVECRAVVLATGLRGTPRKLGARGEDHAKVTYRLIDPEQFHGKRVLVVGGGDSAVEAAIQLAEESTAKVSLSYRQDNFSRAKSRNRDKIDELFRTQRVRPLLSTEVTSVEDGLVRLKTKDGEGVLKNDAIIVSVGGELPAEFLKAVGVSIKRFTGQEKGAKVKDGGPARPPSKAELEQRSRRRLSVGLFVVGALIMAGLFFVGRDYYLTSPAERAQHPMHEWLRPAGLWGHAVGVGATVMMLATLIYPLRKRWSLLKGASNIRSWLTFHMFVGVMSPLIIAFHSAFVLNNLLAVWTWAALVVIVGTGVFGRFLFGFVPAQAGKLLELSEVRTKLKELHKHLQPRLAEATNADVVHALFERANEVPAQKSLLRLILEQGRVEKQLRAEIAIAEPYFPDPKIFASFRDGLVDIAKSRVQEAFYASLKRLFRVWLVFHVVLAVAAVILVAAHIGLSIALGYVEGFA